MNLYSIYDKKSLCFGNVIAMDNDVNARRFFEGMIRQDGIYHDYKDDFALWCVGQFEVDSGTIVPLVNKKVIVDGSSLDA